MERPATIESKRLHYIDWLRVAAVLLLLPFHTGRVFDPNDPFYVKGTELSTPLGHALSFVDQWHMPLLFFLAGASTFLALRKRTARQYVAERLRRLLVPLLFGMLVLIPPQTWYGARSNSGYLESFPHYLLTGDFFEMNMQDGGDYYGGLGIGHLWFVLFLLVISLIVLPLWRPGEHRHRLREQVSRLLSHPIGWLVAGFIIYLAEGLPGLGGKNLLYYLVFFVFGYLALSSEEFMARAEQLAWVALATGAGVAVWWVAGWRFRGSLADPSLALAAVNIIGMTARWLVIVGVVGVGRRCFNRASPALAYLAEGSYPIYIIHQTAIVALAFYVIRAGVAWPLQALVLLVGATAATFLAYEGVKRIAWLRIAFGMRPRSISPRPAATPSTRRKPSDVPFNAGQVAR